MITRSKIPRRRRESQEGLPGDLKVNSKKGALRLHLRDSQTEVSKAPCREIPKNGFLDIGSLFILFGILE